MKPPAFSYVRAECLDEALSLLAEFGDEAKLLAGGQSLVPLLNLRLARPAVLVDIGAVPELRPLRVSAGRLIVGAGVRQRTVETSSLVAAECPGLVEAVSRIGHLQIRNRGTIGGSLAHADPAAELPLLAVAFDARLRARSVNGERILPATQFFSGPFTTTLAPDEILVEISFPVGRRRVAVREESRRTGDFAVVGAAGWLELDAGGVVTDLGVSVCGAAGVPERLASVERAVRGRPVTSAVLADAEALAAETVTVGPNTPDSAYRRHLAGVLVARVIEGAAA